ncbi:hypothetical protein AVEN_257378-1 [Araneus ventricosus]|uniref:Uncharacterized protein n=1 Tax=Araneus ventricosus TaxID=182803 RepID=A0A4Y2C8V1_ARAVE|nr:hypothetical protein AVEN_257378-1 [Araneus ventricosus]
MRTFSVKIGNVNTFLEGNYQLRYFYKTLHFGGPDTRLVRLSFICVWIHVVNRKSSIIDVLKTAGFLLFPSKVSFTRCEPEALSHPRIVTRSFIFFRPGAIASFSAAKVFVGSDLQYSPVSSQLYIWLEVNFSFTIKSCNSAIKLSPASISDDSFSPTNAQLANSVAILELF